MCLKDFWEFLQEYKVIGLAVAFVMGAATNDLVKSLVENIVMPLIAPFVPGGAWETYTIFWGPFQISMGPFLASLLNFAVIAFVIFMLLKAIPKKKK